MGRLRRRADGAFCRRARRSVSYRYTEGEGTLKRDNNRSLTFSVGIPTFSQADFLEHTIESLLRQTRPPDEIVVSDHFSTDRTPEILRKYAGRVIAVTPPPGSNLTDQYNFTLASQTGDWFSLLSSDDIARP